MLSSLLLVLLWPMLVHHCLLPPREERAACMGATVARIRRKSIDRLAFRMNL